MPRKAEIIELLMCKDIIHIRDSFLNLCVKFINFEGYANSGRHY